MIIDGHCHVGTWNEPSFSGRGSTLSDAIDVYHQSGVDGALVMPTDQADHAGVLNTISKTESSVSFRLCAWIDPRDPDNLAWMKSHYEDIAAVKIHPSFVKLPPTDLAYKPALALAQEHEWPVLIHCGRWQEMSSYRFGIELGKSHPELNIILCHMGGDSTDLVDATVSALTAPDGPSNVYLGTESVRQYWCIQDAIDRLGASRVIFGSDYNLNHPSSFVAIVDALTLSAADRSRVFGGNLNDLLPAAHRFF